MKLTERDVTTAVFRIGATLVTMFMMALLALIGQELGVYASLGPSLVKVGLSGFLLMVAASLWPGVSELIRCSRSIVNQYWRQPSRD